MKHCDFCSVIFFFLTQEPNPQDQVPLANRWVFLRSLKRSPRTGTQVWGTYTYYFLLTRRYIQPYKGGTTLLPPHPRLGLGNTVGVKLPQDSHNIPAGYSTHQKNSASIEHHFILQKTEKRRTSQGTPGEYSRTKSHSKTFCRATGPVPSIGQFHIGKYRGTGLEGDIGHNNYMKSMTLGCILIRTYQL